ncbi:30S ribosomal protein S18 [Patescibacteria group bacterium]|nr:30S ribosomal protein S18 [Patescibacteria group bacterium]MBU1682728.1 30S ribosomal protein S18 [Patescibacteria group bacterium]MBU1934888.1 30S ribosomal protein S18 [Patescibacteria group bacterium]
MAKYIFSTNQKHPLGKRRCTFCTNQMGNIDYKDVKTLRNFISGFKKIKNRYYSGVCLQHQKKLARAIKRARHVALIPFTN